MADDSLSSTAPEGQQGEPTTPELTASSDSAGVSARKTGKNQITVDIAGGGGGIMRRVSRSAPGAAGTAAPATANPAATPTIEPVDIFDDAKVEKMKPQTLPDDLPKEGRDFSLPKQPSSIYNDDQAAAAEDLKNDRAQNPYLKADDDGLSLKGSADIGQGDGTTEAVGVAAINNNGDSTPSALSPQEQADSVAPEMAQQNELARGGQTGIDPNTRVPEVPKFKNDLRTDTHRWEKIKLYIPEVEFYLSGIDILIEKNKFSGAARSADILAIRSKVAERTAAFRERAKEIIVTSESIAPPIFLAIACATIPKYVSLDARTLGKFTELVDDFARKLRKHQKTRASVLAQQNQLSAAVEQAGSLQPPPRPA